MAEALRTAAPRASEQRIRRTLGYSDMRASFELSPSAPSVAEKRTASVDVRASGPKLNPGGGLDSAANVTRDPRGSRYGSEHTPSMPCRGVSTAVRRTSCSLGQAGFQCVFFGTPRGLGLATATTSAGLLAAPRERVRLQRTGPASRMGCIGVPIEQENRDAHEQGIRRRN